METAVLFSTVAVIFLFLAAKYASDTTARRLRGTAYVFILLVPGLVVWRMFVSLHKMRQVLVPPELEDGGATAYLWPGIFLVLVAGALWWLRWRQNIPLAPTSLTTSAAASAGNPAFPVGVYVIALALFGLALVLLGIIYLLYALRGMSGAQLQALIGHPVWKYVLAFVLLRMDNVLYFAVPAAILIVTSVGLILLMPWARVAAVLIAGLMASTMLSMLSAALLMRRGMGTKPFIAAFFAWVVWYLNRAGVREAFEPREAAPPLSPPAGPKAGSTALGC